MIAARYLTVPDVVADLPNNVRDELNAVTGCDYGELAPTGKLFGIPLLLDIDFTREQEIFMNAGRVDVSFVVHPDDLLRLEEPLIFQME